MALFLDLESLASLLDEEPETDVEAEEQEPVNSYLVFFLVATPESAYN